MEFRQWHERRSGRRNGRDHHRSRDTALVLKGSKKIKGAFGRLFFRTRFTALKEPGDPEVSSRTPETVFNGNLEPHAPRSGSRHPPVRPAVPAPLSRAGRA